MHDLCVVFDVDDTLCLERNYAISGFRAVGNWAARWLGAPDFGERCIDLFETGHRGDTFNSALESVGLKPCPELIAGLVTIYRSHVPEIAMEEDAGVAVAEIVKRWPIAVITDGPVTSQTLKCDALGLPAFARPVIATGIYGPECHKPQPAAFQRVEREVQAKQYLYVADNPLKDFQAPRSLGWKCVRIRRSAGLHFHRENGVVQPDFEFADCSGLPDLLGNLPR